jgi:hypothetical protein
MAEENNNNNSNSNAVSVEASLSNGANIIGGGENNILEMTPSSASNGDNGGEENTNSNDDDDDDESVLSLSKQTNRPKDVPIQQQRINAWHPILDPNWMIVSYLILALIMIPFGTYS